MSSHRKLAVVLCLLIVFIAAQTLATPYHREIGHISDKEQTRKTYHDQDDDRQYEQVKAKKDEDDDDDDLSLSDDDDDNENDDDDEIADFVDQRQNGTENYRIRVNGLLLIVMPPEPELPPPVTMSPTNINSNTNGNFNSTNIIPGIAGGLYKRRFLKRRYEQQAQQKQANDLGESIIQKQKRKLYQVRIPHFITSLLNGRL